MLFRPMPHVNKWTLPFVGLKIICFIFLYILFGMTLLSFFWGWIYQILDNLVNGEFRLFFCLYLVITGLSCLSIITFRAEADTQLQVISDKSITSTYQRESIKTENLMGVIFQGMIFLISGIFIFMQPIGFKLSLIWILIILVLPQFGGAIVKNFFQCFAWSAFSLILLILLVVNDSLKLMILPIIIGEICLILFIISSTGLLIYTNFINPNSGTK